MKKVLWMGVTPLEMSTERSHELVQYIGSGYEAFCTEETAGMKEYDPKYMRQVFGILGIDVVATDEENIDESYENFFCADNWGKKIVQYKNDAWTELQPGFSKEQVENLMEAVRSKSSQNNR